jgi:hypothetical protein
MPKKKHNGGKRQQKKNEGKAHWVAILFEGAFSFQHLI